MCVAALGRGFDMGKNGASRLWFPAQLDGKHMEIIIWPCQLASASWLIRPLH